MKLSFPGLHAAQEEIHQDGSRFQVVAAGRRFGKTRLGAIRCVEVGMGVGVDREGGRAWWIAPTYKIARVGWRSILEVSRQIPHAEIRLSDMEITYPTGGMVGVRSTDSPAGLRAEGLDLAVLDEAAYMPEERWKEDLRPALSDRLGSALFISTPRGFNWFHDLWQRGEGGHKAWRSFQYPTSANPLISEIELADAREELGSHVFSQEYLAEFVEVGGGLFKRADFRYATQFISEDDDGEEEVWYRYGSGSCRRSDLAISVFVDPAVSTKQTADYTAMAVVGFTPDNQLILLEMVRERMEGPDIIPASARLMTKWGAGLIGIESVGYQLTLIQEARRAGLPVKKLRPVTDKLARAFPLQARFEAHQVHFLADQPWITDLESELLVFRGDDEGHDDQVDALAYAAIERSQRREWKVY
jgi:predicted phage terminase large subunit-like protein